jgi:hypothetical protein
VNVEPASFVERYRGTEWDVSASVGAPAEPPPARPRWALRLFMGGAVLVVLALVAGSVYVLADGSRRRPGQLLAPYGGPQPTPIAAAPAPTGPQATLPALPADWRTNPRHPASVFIGLMSAGRTTYHLDAQGSIDTDAGRLDWTFGLDVAGADAAMTMFLTGAGMSRQVGLIVKDGIEYQRIDDRPWRKVGRAGGAPSPFGALTLDSWARVDYLGRVTTQGAGQYLLRMPVPGWPGVPNPLLSAADEEPNHFWHIWVDDGGRPIVARAVTDGLLAHSDGVTSATMVLNYKFTWFGQRVRIEAPIRSR